MPSTGSDSLLDMEGTADQESIDESKNRERNESDVERPPGPGPGFPKQNVTLISNQGKASEVITESDRGKGMDFSNPIYSLQSPGRQQPMKLQQTQQQTQYQNQTYIFNPAPRMPTNCFIGITPPPVPHMMEYQSEQSSSFTQTFLRGILTSIDSKDPVVANAWLETLLDAIDLLPIDVIRQEIINIAVNKSQLSQPPFSRMAACKMLGKLSTKLDQQSVRQEVLPPTLALCQDVESDVRNCMCRHLSLVARGIGLELTKSAILPMLVELSNDESSDVRLSAIETVVHLLSLLDDEVCNNTIVPLVIKCCDQAKSSEDCSLPVIARHLGRLCHGLTPNLSQDQKSWFIVFYQQLSKIGTTQSTEVSNSSNTPMPDLVPREKSEHYKTEKFVECRQACAYNLPGMVLFVGANCFTDKLFATFCDFATDPSPLVRRTLASSLHELIKIIGSNFSLTKVQVAALFNDNNVDVLAAMVLNMVYVIDALARFGVLQFGSSGSYSQDLSVAILHMEEIINSTRNWRLHADCLEKLSCLANCISAAVIQQRYIPLLFQRAHKSRPLPCRVAAVRTLLVILRFTVKMEDRSNIMFKVKEELAHGKSCHARMLFLKMCEMAIMLFSRTYFKKHFFSELLCLSQDSVANIRLKVVSMLPQLKSLLSLPSDRAHFQHLEETIKELMVVENDRDVLGTLQTSIHRLAEIETALDGGNIKLGPYADEDRDDERKLREEKLIANMEEQIKQVQGAKLDQLVTPSAIPSRLRSLGLDRKRSESLPPALTRTETQINHRPRYSSPEPPRYASPEMGKPSPRPAYSQDIGKSNIWQSKVEQDENIKPSLSTPYSSSLENLDPSTQEFLVDAGIKLPTTTGNMTSAASMPNLTSVGKVKDQIVRSNSIPDNSNLDGELSKYLISNEEMELYEAEYEKAAQEVKKEPSATQQPTNVSSGTPQMQRGRTESKMKPPSFTSALTNKPAMRAATISFTPVAKSTKLTEEPWISEEPSENEAKCTTSNFAISKSPESLGNSPSKMEERMTGSQKWNDGSIERLAEKWAAKRDTLLRETGVLAENLQQRKAAMEQKLESVKRSIPKRSLGFTPQSAQKRLSLCESFIKKNNTPTKKDESPKRKSLDIDIVLPPEAEDSDGDDPRISKKITEIRNMIPPSVIKRKSSPELGSSDSDDSLPPYPSGDKPSIDVDIPLPPPPPSIDELCISSEPVKSLAPSSKYISKPSLISNTLTRSSLAMYKTVSAPQTSVAVSRTILAPQPCIADSPQLPIKKLPKKSESSPQVISFQKSSYADENNTNELETSNRNENILNNSNVRVNLQINPPKQSSKLINSSFDLASTAIQSPATSRLKNFPRKKLAGDTSSTDGLTASKPESNLPDMSKSTTNQQTQKRLTKVTTTQVPPIGTVDKTFSTFKGKSKPVIRENKAKVETETPTASKAGKTVVYVENPPTETKMRIMKPSLTSQKKPQPKSTAGSTSMQNNSVTQYVPHIATVRSGKYNDKSLSTGTSIKESNSVESTPYHDRKFKPSAKSRSRDSSSENLLAPNLIDDNHSPSATPLQLSPTSPGKPGSTGLVGPRKSSGMRMWQGQMNGRRPGSSKQPSPAASRSPSPATRQTAANNIPGKVQDHATLPRSSNMSRLRAPTSQGSQSPQQRRSYGGISSFQGGKNNKYSSAPNTPRQSQADLSQPNSLHSSPGGSRSNSPTPSLASTSVEHHHGYQARTNQLRMPVFNSFTTDKPVQPISPSSGQTRTIPGLLSNKSKTYSGPPGASQSYNGTMRPPSSNKMTSSISRPSVPGPVGGLSSIRPPTLTIPSNQGSSKSRLTAPKGFGFKQK